MKRWLATVLLLLILSGCGKGDGEIEKVMRLREQILNGKGTSFTVGITADYGDKIFRYKLTCEADADETLHFTVMEPEEISGLTGQVSGSGGKITFDDMAVAFELLADGQLSPISAPWLLLHTLRGGYLLSCVYEEELLRVTINDSYEEKALRLEVWLDEQGTPVNAEVLWDGKRIVTMTVENFQFL